MLEQLIFKNLSSALAVLTSMITPALLISACGTFILSTSQRLGRVIDRVRVLSDRMDTLMREREQIELFEERRSMIFDQMERQSARASILQRGLTVFYLAAAIFVATSVAIGIVAVSSSRYYWIPVFLGILGSCFLFYGSLLLIVEARMALSSSAAWARRWDF